MKAKFTKVLLAFGLLFATGGATVHPASAAGNGPDITLNGQSVQFTDVAPITMHDRIFVPYRTLLESLGATVTWDPAANTAVATKDGVTIKVPIGSNVITVNDHPLTMDVASTTVNYRTMVPIRFVSQALGSTVKWSAGDGSAPAKIELNQSYPDMINQLATKTSGDQPVSYEQSQILLDWLQAGDQKKALPAFTGSTPPNVNPFTGQGAPGSYTYHPFPNKDFSMATYVNDLPVAHIEREVWSDKYRIVEFGIYPGNNDADHPTISGPLLTRVVTIFDQTRTYHGLFPWEGFDMADYFLK